MALVNLKGMLDEAREGKYSVGAFDVSNYEMIKAVVDTAEEENSPVILMGLQPDLDNGGMSYLSTMALQAAKNASVPICVHLDHSVSYEHIKAAIENGFTSVMFDGSVLPFEENLEKTREVVELAREYNVSVEAELGHVGDAVSGYSETGGESHDGVLTVPSELEDFVERTGVDTLAVAIGTSHGVYIDEPKLDLDRLIELNSISTVPLVLHGGSGTPDDQVARSIELGICKINIYSEVLNAYYSELRKFLNEETNMSVWPIIANEKPVAAMKEVVRAKMRLFKSSNKAGRVYENV